MTADHVTDDTCPAQARSVARGRILLVDDEQAIRSALGRALRAEGHTVDFAETGSDGLRQAMAGSYDLVILDLLMPGTDGRTALRQLLRDRPAQAVLVLSCLADVKCKVECLELGARDYLTKPFSLAELLARVHTQLRGEGLGAVIRVGELRLHVGRMEADIGRGPTPLTRLEFLVLRELMEHAGQSVSRGRLLASVWGLDFEPGSNIVGVCVRRLRTKLGDHIIRTVRGEGYQLATR
ncbi:MAG: response regulator transcription factor [Streptosporangiaceae bacterium]|nr:response regulator transcription factor [Streptosporangiaceae bacterium]MBV9854518.1 response regulator transcription factor [Streptosporangiaceae bacterium]